MDRSVGSPWTWSIVGVSGLGVSVFRLPLSYLLFFSLGNYCLYSEVGANSRRVVRQIPDEILNNSELQDAVRQVKNWSICLASNFLKPIHNLCCFGAS